MFRLLVWCVLCNSCGSFCPFRGYLQRVLPVGLSGGCCSGAPVMLVRVPGLGWLVVLGPTAWFVGWFGVVHAATGVTYSLVVFGWFLATYELSGFPCNL